MAETHKHKGITRTDSGGLRSHSVTQIHTDPVAKRFHTMELNKTETKPIKTEVKLKISVPIKKEQSNISKLKQLFGGVDSNEIKNVPKNKEGIMVINLNELPSNIKGIMIKFK